MRITGLRRSWIVALSSFVSIGAAGPVVPLVDAVKKADRVAVRAMLQQPQIDVNLPEADGMAALHWAAYLDDLETADLLIRAGANVKAANRYGVTPLSLASVNGNAAMIGQLLKAGADANAASPEGETALMAAAGTGNVAAVKALLAHGADVTAKESSKGQTALIAAGQRRESERAGLEGLSAPRLGVDAKARVHKPARTGAADRRQPRTRQGTPGAWSQPEHSHRLEGNPIRP